MGFQGHSRGVPGDLLGFDGRFMEFWVSKAFEEVSGSLLRF